MREGKCVSNLGMEACVASTAVMMVDFWGGSSSGLNSSSDFSLRLTGLGGGARGPLEPLA